MPSSSGEFLFKGCPKNLLSLMTFLPEAWKLLSRLVNWQVWSIWNLLCIRISDCEKKLSATPSSRGEFLFYKVPQEPVDFNDVSTKMSIRAMEITLNASILQVWSIWNLLCICVSDREKKSTEPSIRSSKFWRKRPNCIKKSQQSKSQQQLHV